MLEKKISVKIAKFLVGKAVGWFQGRMEFGPRALGGRSILAIQEIKICKNAKLKIKFRESFRPSAPSILEEKPNKWFDLEDSSPYMLLVAKVKKEKLIKQKKTVTKKLNDINNIRSIIPSVLILMILQECKL